MREINMADTLARKRRDKGITQDELAGYLGVSKAAVSKWETGQSYPDITMLPLLAAYFNISIDELVDYKPQMVKEDICSLYVRLCRDFSGMPFDGVYGECLEIIKKYYSCPPLLLQMGILLTNHCTLASTPEKTTEVQKYARDLMIHVKEGAQDEYTLSMARYLEAYLELCLGNPMVVVELLEKCVLVRSSGEALLASAYQMTGNREKALETLQITVYQDMMEALGNFSGLLTLYAQDEEKTDMWLESFGRIAEAVDFLNMHPGGLAPVYLTAAMVLAGQGRDMKALQILQKYVDAMAGASFPLTLHGNRYFDKVDGWFEEFKLGTHMPREESVVKDSIIASVEENPSFGKLKETEQYKKMLWQLKAKLGGREKNE